MAGSSLESGGGPLLPSAEAVRPETRDLAVEDGSATGELLADGLRQRLECPERAPVIVLERLPKRQSLGKTHADRADGALHRLANPHVRDRRHGKRDLERVQPAIR
jgi:hypothetical protein